VSRSGAMALSWSMDKIGPICRSVEDCASFQRHPRPDGLDLTVVDRPFNGTPPGLCKYPRRQRRLLRPVPDRSTGRSKSCGRRASARSFELPGIHAAARLYPRRRRNRSTT
jgi:hypothetical protein